jgi:hypothetical protein
VAGLLGFEAKLACWGALGVAAGGLTVAAIVSCLPDLQSPTSPLDAGYCGNGYIDPPSEQCDPGPRVGDAGEAGVVGCSAECQVVCPSDGFVDTTTNHCYFLLANDVVPNSVPNSTLNGCFSPANASHIVTFVSDNEVIALTNSPLGMGLTARYWVGLRDTATLDGGQRVWNSEYTVEPGWAGLGACTGCYANTTNGANGFPRTLDTDAGEGAAACVVATKNYLEHWYSASCQLDLSHSICEREPPGSRAEPCTAGDSDPGDFCIQVVATLGTKTYEYHPGGMDPNEAEQYCKGHGSTPSTSLVVFDTPEEREQLVHELYHLPGGAPPPTQFWIGLAQSDNVWSWDDGQPIASYPSPWGIGAPEPGGTRAYVVLAEAQPDTQLSHSLPLTSAPFVCQY